MQPIDRRQFARTSLALGASVAAGRALRAAEPAADAPRRNCAFVKFLTELGYDELSDRLAEFGFGGVEVTVREKDGYIKPAAAAAELPKFRRSLDKNGLELSIVTTDVVRADQPLADAVLRAAADAGAQRYRLGFRRYDPKQRVVGQLDAFRAQFDQLAALNRRIKLPGMYQNHCGAGYFGATIWDLYYVIRSHAPEELGCVYDLRHATVEAGESWPTLYEVIKPHVIAYSVKDFVWGDRESRHAPLGEGRVDRQFYARLAKSQFDGPVSLHVEYLPGEPAEAQLAAMKRDLATLRDWMSG